MICKNCRSLNQNKELYPLDIFDITVHFQKSFGNKYKYIKNNSHDLCQLTVNTFCAKTRRKLLVFITSFVKF